MHYIVDMYMQNVTQVGSYFTGYIEGDETYKSFINDINIVSTRFCIRSSNERQPLANEENKTSKRWSSNGGFYLLNIIFFCCGGKIVIY